jgi:hypothetical protein
LRLAGRQLLCALAPASSQKALLCRRATGGSGNGRSRRHASGSGAWRLRRSRLTRRGGGLTRRLSLILRWSLRFLCRLASGALGTHPLSLSLFACARFLLSALALGPLLLRTVAR